MKVRAAQRSIAGLLAPLDRLAAGSCHLIANHGANFENGGETYELPRYLFVGPRAGDEPLRIGVFAAIHGDEPEGAHALVQFLELLEGQPEWVAGYRLFAYPVCNPTGFEDGTRHSRAGKDLNREFWRGSAEPEVRLLQSELVAHAFHGIISLHTDKDADGFYGVAQGATLAKHLLEPALAAASEAFLPRNSQPFVGGFQAREGVVTDWFKGTLGAPPKVRPRPFEITLAAPAAQPTYLKQLALVTALHTILAEYRKFIAFSVNL
jgi:hypothetical protein